MSAISPTLSQTELSQRILEMATTGVYRESVFEAFKPIATKKQISSAIALSKQYGLRSDASLRDPELGTYYLIDLQQYEQSQQLAAAHVALAPGEDVTDRLTVALQTLHAAISIAGSITVVLIVIGSLCVLSGRLINGAVVYCSAFWTGIIWLVQRQLTQKVLLPPGL
ncbi:MAG: hypothetical protein AAFY78_11460 [Cyanobacteria bacterium J06648_16]